MYDCIRLKIIILDYMIIRLTKKEGNNHVKDSLCFSLVLTLFQRLTKPIRLIRVTYFKSARSQQ